MTCAERSQTTGGFKTVSFVASVKAKKDTRITVSSWLSNQGESDKGDTIISHEEAVFAVGNLDSRPGRNLFGGVLQKNTRKVHSVRHNPPPPLHRTFQYSYTPSLTLDTPWPPNIWAGRKTSRDRLCSHFKFNPQQPSLHFPRVSGCLHEYDTLSF